jgi:hypothetical protein
MPISTLHIADGKTKLMHNYIHKTQDKTTIIKSN